MYSLYRTLTVIAAPLIPLLLKRRLARGKEDKGRLQERLGRAMLPRPEGKLVWIHAASVGEANAVLPLIEALLKEHAPLHILLTTVTVTSAALMAKRLPLRAIHQFAPVDTLRAVHSFLEHWRPDIALWVDSEFWPNLMVETQKAGVLMGIVNARMSDRSFKRWQRMPSFIRTLLSGFKLCFAQSDADAERLKMLGVPSITGIQNLKYDAPELMVDAKEMALLNHQADSRPVITYASTHPGEEAQIAGVHRTLAKTGMRPLTVIVPRHAVRGGEIAAELEGFHIARRSQNQPITRDTEIYLADTMGELGLFYRLANLVFIGGSLIPHGGQNPLEAARLGCAIVAGPHMENFAGIVAGMEKEGALLRVKDADSLANEAMRVLPDEKLRASLGAKAEKHVKLHAGALAAITQELRRYLA